MGKISRRAADEIRQTIQIVKGLPPGGAGFADPGMPIRLAKTTAAHAVGVTQDVTLMWGDKGDESEGTEDRDTVPAYNRFAELETDSVVHIARVGVGWEILGRASADTGGTCGGCSSAAGTGDVDLGDDLIVSEFYQIDWFCSGVLTVIYNHTGGGTFAGDAADGMTVTCAGDTTVTFTSSVAVSGHLPGEVVATLTDGVNTWTATNEVSWDPTQNTSLTLVSGPLSCPCAPFRQFPCLRPRETGLA